MKKNKKLPKKSLLIAAVACLLIAGGSALALSGKATSPDKKVPVNETAQPETQTVETPASSTDSDSDSNEVKQRIVEDQKKAVQNPAQSGHKTVTPLITYGEHSGSSVEVVAYVPGIAEENGTCTMTASKDGKIVVKKVPASQNANTTDCQAFVVPRSEFPTAGKWDVRVVYQSPTAEGSSAVWPLTVK